MDWPISWLSVCLVSFPCGCLEVLSYVWMPIPGVKALLAWFNIVAVCLFGSEWCLKVEHDDQLFVQTNPHQPLIAWYQRRWMIFADRASSAADSCGGAGFSLRNVDDRRIFRGFHPSLIPSQILAQSFDKTVISCFLSFAKTPQHYAKLLNIPSSSS